MFNLNNAIIIVVNTNYSYSIILLKGIIVLYPFL